MDGRADDESPQDALRLSELALYDAPQEVEFQMRSPSPPPSLSAKRFQLCSRENALRVASRLFNAEAHPVSIIRTGTLLQPYRVSTSPTRDDHVELQMVS